jgi:hypothetical protein
MGSTTKKDPSEYTVEEAQHRFEAALRGARVVGHKQMKDLPRKRPTEKPLRKRHKRKDRQTGEE